MLSLRLLEASTQKLFFRTEKNSNNSRAWFILAETRFFVEFLK